MTSIAILSTEFIPAVIGLSGPSQHSTSAQISADQALFVAAWQTLDSPGTCPHKKRTAPAKGRFRLRSR